MVLNTQQAENILTHYCYICNISSNRVELINKILTPVKNWTPVNVKNCVASCTWQWLSGFWGRPLHTLKNNITEQNIFANDNKFEFNYKTIILLHVFISYNIWYLNHGFISSLFTYLYCLSVILPTVTF